MTELVPLGEFANVFNGKTPAKSDQRSAGHPVLKIKDVDETGEFRGTFESFVDPEFAERHIKKRVVANDILVLNAAHNADYVGSKTYKAQCSVDGAVATGEWLIARSSDTRLHQDYLWHWFQAPATRFQIRRQVKGIHLYPRDVAAMRIPLPPVEEQRRIAAILDKADAIRRKRQQALALADDFLKSVFLEMFGDPHRNPNKYPVRKFETLLTIPLRNGISPSSKGAVSASVLTLSAITGEKFDATQIKEGKFLQPISKTDQVDVEDFYICRGNGSPDLVGKGYFADQCMEGVAFPDTMIAAKINVDEICRGFFQVIWNSPFVRGQIIEAARTTNGTFKVNQTATGGIRIPTPPKARQEVFEHLVRKVHDVRERLSFEDDLFASLSQRAFRGEL